MVYQNILYVVIVLLLTAGWTVAARHFRPIRESRFSAGLWFGQLSLVFSLLRFQETAGGISIGFRNIPPFLAAFFFDPAAGVIAGVVGAVGKIIYALYSESFQTEFWRISWQADVLPWQISVAASLLIACYAAGMAQWIFERKQPPFIVAAIAASYGVILQYGVIMLLSFPGNNFPRALEFLNLSYPEMPLTAGIAVGLAALICSPRKEWFRSFFAPLTWGFLLFGVTFAVLGRVVIDRAFFKTDKALRIATEKLENEIDAKISVLLYHRAFSLKKVLERKLTPSQLELQRLAALFDIDEINVFDADGRLLASNNDKVMAFNQERRDWGALKPFQALVQGQQEFVHTPFRASRSEPGVIAKYFGLPLQNRRAFLQLGYYFGRHEKEFSTFFLPTFRKTKVESLGFFIVTDPEGRIAVDVADQPPFKGKRLTEIVQEKLPNDLPTGDIIETRMLNVYGRLLHCGDTGPWKIYAFLPYQDFFDDALLITEAVSFLLFILGIIIRLVYLHTARMQKKIDDMREEDLKLAATIQNSELQQHDLKLDCCRVAAAMTPAKEVGGDFYDYYELPDGRIAVTIADVSGKGVPAAFFMIKAKSLLKNELLKGGTLPEVTARVNRALNQNNDACMFVTAWTGLFSPATGVLEYVSAGHNPPLVRRRDGAVEWLNAAKRRKPLAAFPNSSYAAESVTLLPGDRLFLYTDGITEAMNNRKELFGTERLEETLRNAPGSDLIEVVTAAVKQFTAGAPQTDDMTTLTMEIIAK